MMTNDRPKRRLLASRRTRIIAVVIVVVGAPLAWFVIDIWRVFVDEPELTYTFRQQLMELAGEQQAKGENGWTALADVIARYPSESADVVAKFLETMDIVDSPSSLLQNEANELMLESRIMDDLRTALAMQQFVRSFGSVGTMNHDRILPPNSCNDIATLLTRSTVQAISSNRWDNAIDLNRMALRFARAVGSQPLPMYFRFGVSAEFNITRSLRQALRATEVPPDVAAQLIAPITEAPDRNAAITYVIERQRLSLMCNLYWLHGSRGYALPNPSAIAAARAFTQTAPAQMRLFAGDVRTTRAAMTARWKLATYDECEDLLDRWFKAMTAEAQKPYASRWFDWPPADLDAKLLEPRFGMLNLVIKRVNTFDIDLYEMLLVERRLTLLTAAAEQFRVAHDRPPNTLDELVPEWIPEIPIDPVSGIRFCYKLLESDPAGNEYMIYGAGTDGIDNGGVFLQMQAPHPGLRTDHGLDLKLER